MTAAAGASLLADGLPSSMLPLPFREGHLLKADDIAAILPALARLGVAIKR